MSCEGDKDKLLVLADSKLRSSLGWNLLHRPHLAKISRSPMPPWHRVFRWRSWQCLWRSRMVFLAIDSDLGTDPSETAPISEGRIEAILVPFISTDNELVELIDGFSLPARAISSGMPTSAAYRVRHPQVVGRDCQPRAESNDAGCCECQEF